MGYNNVSLKAANQSVNKKHSPVDTWRHFVKEEYPDSKESQKKGCPKNAFLGLCGEGKIKGIAAGIYTNSKSNKLYALTAVEILRINPKKNYTSSELWKEVLKTCCADPDKRHNAQMDVVLALWNNGLIAT